MKDRCGAGAEGHNCKGAEGTHHEALSCSKAAVSPSCATPIQPHLTVANVSGTVMTHMPAVIATILHRAETITARHWQLCGAACACFHSTHGAVVRIMPSSGAHTAHMRLLRK